jgi:predicted nucleic acid-binding protein
MPQLLWDASALVKRYLTETGTATVHALFAAAPAAAMWGTFLGYAETGAVLRRRTNAGDLPPAAFSAARAALRSEVLDDPDFQLLTVDDAAFLAGITLTDLHNLNSSDAALLAPYLRYARLQPAGSPTCVLIASDQRLLRAAQLEGLATLNPELVLAADVPAALAAL